MKYDDSVVESLFSIIRSAFIFPADRLGLVDNDYLIQIGQKQSILPIIWYGLKRMMCDDERTKQIYKLICKDIYRSLRRDHALAVLCTVLREASIPYVPLKGSVIRDYYPETWMRTSCDIDILVPEEKLDKAIETIEKNTDFRFRLQNYHDVSMINREINLELHFSLKEDNPNIDKILERVWDYVEGDKLTPEFQIFHVVAHMSYHFVHGGLGIRPYIDLWLLRNRTMYDENEVQRLCETCGLLTFYQECCALTEVWFENRVHSDISRALEQYSLSGGVFGSQENALLAKQCEYKGISYIVHRLFMNTEDLVKVYPKLIEHPIFLPYYQIKRWVKSISSGREKIQEELQMRKDKREDIDSFDKLMQNVGL